MKIMNVMVGLGMLAMTSSAFATTTGFTEGVRTQVAGTTVITPTDAPSNGGFDLGDLTAVGDVISLHGRIVNAADAYTFSSATAFTVEFIFGGLTLANMTTTDTSGFTFDTQGGPASNTSNFSLDDGMGTVLVEQFMTEITGGPSLIFSAGPGDYTFIIDGIPPSGGALYDIQITAVPLPAALPLLLGGMGLLGVFGRKKKTELV